MNNLFERKGAIFNESGKCKYRYVLWRIWDETKPLVMFIGLNPSTANGETDDPTIKSVLRISMHNGYGGVYMMNLFGVISPYPEVLQQSDIDPIGDNDMWHDSISRKCKDVVFAWGTFKEAKQRSEYYIEKYPKALCIGKNADGSPKHPLFQKGNSVLNPYHDETI